MNVLGLPNVLSIGEGSTLGVKVFMFRPKCIEYISQSYVAQFFRGVVIARGK
jgi:hypothetical protein